MSTKIKLLENELKKNEEKIVLLQYKCNDLWDERDVIHAKIHQVTNKTNNVKKINETINEKIIQLKKINNNIV